MFENPWSNICVHYPLFNCDYSGLFFCSLYNNNICDFGAENLAKVLPAMTSLRVLEWVWNLLRLPRKVYFLGDWKYKLHVWFYWRQKLRKMIWENVLLQSPDSQWLERIKEHFTINLKRLVLRWENRLMGELREWPQEHGKRNPSDELTNLLNILLQVFWIYNLFCFFSFFFLIPSAD